MTDTLRNNKDILQTPPPVVILQTFVDNGIDVKEYYSGSRICQNRVRQVI